MAKKKRAVRLEDLNELKGVSHPRVSPDGKRVVYVVTSVDVEADRNTSAIWIARLDGQERPRQFTQGPNAQTPAWSPDGSSLAFVANRGEGGQLFVAPFDGGEARQLTRAKASSTSPCWSPNGKQIVVTRSVGEKHGGGSTPAERNAPRVIRDLYYRFDGFGLYDARRRHLFVIDVESGEERQLTDGDWHDLQPAWSPDGKYVGFISDRSTERWSHRWREELWVVPSRGGRARRLTRERGSVSAYAFSPDGSEIAYVGHEYGDAYPGRNIHLWTVPVRGGRAPQRLTGDLDRSVAGAPMAGEPLSWLPDSSAIVFLAGDRGTTPIWTVERASGAIKKILDADLQVTALDLTPNGREVVFSASGSAELAEVRALRLSGGAKQRLVSDANAKLRAEVTLTPTQRIRYKSTDGLEIEAFVLHPPGVRRGRHHPLALDIHGGPHGMHPSAYKALEHQVMAAAGYVVLLPNPRGSTSYGEQFESGCLGDWGGGDCADILAGVDELVRRGDADPERLYVGGYSYGGYMSSWIVTQDERFRAAFIGAPITNLASGIGTDDIPVYNVSDMEGPPWLIPDEYTSRSPITHVARVKTPVLLVHWEGDLRCPIGQSEEFFVALKLLRREAEFVRYPGGAHGVRTPSQGVDMLRRNLDWYARHAPSSGRTRR